ncbi:AAA family ATPase [[Bacillus] enclensis]|uniref:MoxR-like ATPase n=1 Tax=[Bacillus] enclensis TaxID=1402860 RepID=A0A0V8H9B6_9BACI|nr:MoxR family ATPase [[Bacillus] enclensis]KSU59024.1 AAA family ATPase [[Bacillus] enclensis]SCC31519.1 MoxR-like ATPase [[Bacillus] enclensis]
MLQHIKENVAKVMIDKEKEIELMIIALLSDGHILLEDVPGTGKTTMAKCFSRSIDGTFNRLQFTPDTLPSDIVGQEYFDVKTSDFKVRKGPVFNNVLLIDEINRAVPRTQSALLELMEEKHVTLGGVTYHLPKPFCVIATQNPYDSIGTFPLPDAQLDRFLLTIRQGYPSPEKEKMMLRRFRSANPLATIESVISIEDVIQLKQKVKDVVVSEEVEDYLMEIVQATRQHQYVDVGVSPRGSLAYMRAAQSRAFLYGRDFSTPDDVKELALPILAHRITLNVEGEVKTSKEAVIHEILDSISVPVETP